MESKKIQFKNGLKDGLPIGLGYLPISFSFGMMADLGGVPAHIGLLISMLCLTSSGQFAGLNIMINGGTYLETAITTIVINLRYMLMSLALSQKTEKMSFVKRMIISFGITDEIFAVSALKPHKVTYWYMLGLTVLPYAGWSLGTLAGILIADILPDVIASAMSITLYAMFIAIFVPAAKKEKSVLIAVITAALISYILYYTPLSEIVSDSWKMIIAAVAASAVCASIFPHREDIRK